MRGVVWVLAVASKPEHQIGCIRFASPKSIGEERGGLIKRRNHAGRRSRPIGCSKKTDEHGMSWNLI